MTSSKAIKAIQTALTIMEGWHGAPTPTEREELANVLQEGIASEPFDPFPLTKEEREQWKGY